MSQLNDSATRTGSKSIIPLPGKGSKSIIPKGSTPAASALGNQNTCQPSSANEMNEYCGVVSKLDKTATQLQGESSLQLNSENQTPRNRVSALPTFTASRRSVVKNQTMNRSKPSGGVNSALQKRQLENQFATKRQKYMALRRDLVEKQKQAVDLYEDVNELRDKVIAAGFKDPGKIEKILHIKSEIKEKNFSPEGGAAGEQLLSNYNLTSVIPSDFISTFEEKLNEVSKVTFDECLEALTKRTEIISSISESNDKNPGEFSQEIIEILQLDKIENEVLIARLGNVADKQQAVIDELFQKTSLLWGEHENYRIHIKDIEASSVGLINDLKEKLSATTEELESEREKLTQVKDKKNVTETQLQKARTRIRELENHATANETKIQQLQGTVRNLEAHVKQKEAAIEARTKDMNKSVKNSESLVAKAEKQRDSLESRVNDLKKKIDSKEAEFNENVKNITKELEDTRTQLTAEKDLKSKAEEKLKVVNDRCKKLEEKSQQLCDLAERRKDSIVKPVDGKYTENEIQLWNELQSARNALNEKDEKLIQVQRQKENIISVLQEAADRDESIPGSGKNKLAAELVTKTEQLETAIAEREQFRKSLKTATERSENSEKQLSDLQSKLHAQTKEGGKTGWTAHTIELQQQLCDMRTMIRDLNQHNEELETALTQKQLEVEQRDRIMREQSKVLKVRDELIALLKGKNPENVNGDSAGFQNCLNDQQMKLDPGTISRLVNKQIAAKAEDLQTLYSTLESKQMQLMRLEKVVRQMEADNDRSQATRTKLEKEVAQLRLQLHEKKNRERRYVGVKRAVDYLKRPKTSPKIMNGNSASELKFPGDFLPGIPALVPIRSRHYSGKSTSSLLDGEKFGGNNQSMEKLRDIVRAVEIEKARGSGGGNHLKRVSRSLQRSSEIKNSTEIREDLYNWLMHPAGVCDVDYSKREFLRHSKTIFNEEFPRPAPATASNNFLSYDNELRGDDEISERSREFRVYRSNRDSYSSYLIRPDDDSTMRRNNKRERIRVLK